MDSTPPREHKNLEGAREPSERVRSGLAEEMRSHHLPRYTLGEEIANSVTHGIGALLSAAALVLLIMAALETGEPLALVSAIIFGISLIMEYLASTLYHAIQHPRAKAILRLIDHSSIALLIAGSYSPFLLVTLKDHGGVGLFVLIWVFALAGILIEIIWPKKPRWITVVLYLAMGWIVVLKIQAILLLLPAPGLWLLVAGGISYTVGTIFYLLKKVPYMHSVWHLFVLGGSICHVLAVLLYVY